MQNSDSSYLKKLLVLNIKYNNLTFNQINMQKQL